jgi:hypothetical protein
VYNRLCAGLAILLFRVARRRGHLTGGRGAHHQGEGKYFYLPWRQAQSFDDNVWISVSTISKLEFDTAEGVHVILMGQSSRIHYQLHIPLQNVYVPVWLWK